MTYVKCGNCGNQPSKGLNKCAYCGSLNYEDPEGPYITKDNWTQYPELFWRAVAKRNGVETTDLGVRFHTNTGRTCLIAISAVVGFRLLFFNPPEKFFDYQLGFLVPVLLVGILGLTWFGVHLLRVWRRGAFIQFTQDAWRCRVNTLDEIVIPYSNIVDIVPNPHPGFPYVINLRVPMRVRPPLMNPKWYVQDDGWAKRWPVVGSNAVDPQEMAFLLADAAGVSLPVVDDSISSAKPKAFIGRIDFRAHNPISIVLAVLFLFYMISTPELSTLFKNFSGDKGWTYLKRGQVEDGLRWLSASAWFGNRGAQVYLGIANLDGSIPGADPKEGVYWLERVARLGRKEVFRRQRNFFRFRVETLSPEVWDKARLRLAKYYALEQDPPVPSNIETALRHAENAMRTQNTTAYLLLGRMRELGVGGDRDLTRAFELYELSAYRGNAEAMFHLGRMYMRGRGVGQDKSEGFRWMRRAHSAGHKPGK